MRLYTSACGENQRSTPCTCTYAGERGTRTHEGMRLVAKIAGDRRISKQALRRAVRHARASSAAANSLADDAMETCNTLLDTLARYEAGREPGMEPASDPAAWWAYARCERALQRAGEAASRKVAAECAQRLRRGTQPLQWGQDAAGKRELVPRLVAPVALASITRAWVDLPSSISQGQMVWDTAREPRASTGWESNTGHPAGLGPGSPV